MIFRRYEAACVTGDLVALRQLYATEDAVKIQTLLQNPEISNRWARINLSATKVQSVFGFSEEGRITALASVTLKTNAMMMPFQIDATGSLRLADFKSSVVGMFLSHSEGIASGRYQMRLERYE